jgi:hypothetical protein
VLHDAFPAQSAEPDDIWARDRDRQSDQRPHGQAPAPADRQSHRRPSDIPAESSPDPMTRLTRRQFINLLSWTVVGRLAVEKVIPQMLLTLPSR